MAISSEQGRGAQQITASRNRAPKSARSRATISMAFGEAGVSKYSELDKAIAAERGKRLNYADQSEKAFQLTREWLIKYSNEYDNEIRRVLITGAFSAAVEVVSAAYLGLMRSAL